MFMPLHDGNIVDATMSPIDGEGVGIFQIMEVGKDHNGVTGDDHRGRGSHCSVNYNTTTIQSEISRLTSFD